MFAATELQDASTIPSRWSGSLSISETEDLVHRVKLGDTQAFATLYRAYVSCVHRYVANRVDSSRVEDVVAEVFVRALKNINRYEFRGQEVSAWLIRIARNILLDQMKSAQHRREVLHHATPELADEDLLEHTVLSSLDAENVRGAMTRLRPEHREVLERRFLKGDSGSQVAEAMERSEGAVRILQYRALKALKTELQESDLQIHLAPV